MQFYHLSRKLRTKVNFDAEELNQYYLEAEILDDVEANSVRMRNESQSNRTKYDSRKNYLPQDNYLTDLTEELNEALLQSVRHHKVLLEFTKLLEEFFNMFVLLKTIQTTVKVSLMTYTFLKVNSLVVEFGSLFF